MFNFNQMIEFLKRNGWDIEKMDEATVRCSVGEFSFNACYRAPNKQLGTEEEVILMFPCGNDEIWSLIQVVLNPEVEVMRCRDPINPGLFGEKEEI